MIEVSELVKYYSERKILKDLNFSVAKGRVCGFLGPNGSGKSTTMDILAGLLGPSSGTVEVCGYDVVKHPREVKACVGYLPDNPPLYKEMYVYDFIDFSAKLHGLTGSKGTKAVKAIIEECDIGDVQKRLIGNLSKGYRQRVALCAALVHKPKVLILDEPTEGLDPTQIVLIRNLIKKLANERTVILSSHILPEVQATCDDVVIIVNGEIRAKFFLDDEQASTKQYLFRFADQIEDILAWFTAQLFVAKVSVENENQILVQFNNHLEISTEERLAFTVKSLVNKKFPLIGLQEKKNGLEEIFFDVIQTTSAHQDLH